jgi:hypothetical protein
VVAGIVTTGSTTVVSLQIGANFDGARSTSIIIADRLFLISQVAAAAGATVIPTLDPWMLAALSLLLVAGASSRTKRPPNSLRN